MVKDIVPSDTMPEYLNIMGLMPDGDNITIYFTNYGYTNQSATERLESVKFNTNNGKLSDYQTFDDIVGNSMEGTSLAAIYKVQDIDLVLMNTFS